jgi:hypothetical protein
MVPQNRPAAVIHVADRLDSFRAGSLGLARSREVASHLLLCEVCFAAYLAALLRRA